MQEGDSEDEDDGDHGVQEPALVADMTPAKKPKMDENASRKKGKTFTNTTPATAAALQPAKAIRQIPLTEWEWIIPARYQQVLWNSIVYPGISSIVSMYTTEHPTTANVPSAQYAHRKAVSLSEIWSRVHEFSKREMDKEFLAEVGSGVKTTVATERFHLKFAFYNDNVNRLLHHVIQGYINFYENEVYHQVRREEVCKLVLEGVVKPDQLGAVDSQHEDLRSLLNDMASKATEAFNVLFEQKIALKPPSSASSAAFVKPIQASSAANMASASTVLQAPPPANNVQYQLPAMQPQVRPLNAAVPLYSVNGQRISFDQDQQMLQQQQQRDMAYAPNNATKQTPVNTQSPAPVVNFAPVPLSMQSPAPLDSKSPVPLNSQSPAPSNNTAYRQAYVPVYNQSPTALNTQSPSPAAASYAPSPVSSSQAPSTKALPVSKVPANNQPNEAAQGRQEQLFLSNFIQKLCNFPTVQLVNMLAHLKDSTSNYRPSRAQDSARLKVFNEMNTSQMIQLLNLLQWKVNPSTPAVSNTNQQQASPPTLYFDQRHLDAIIAQKATVERITKQFDDENIYAAISLLSKGHVELFEKLSDAELLKFFSDQSILNKLVHIFRDLDMKASGAAEPATVSGTPPVASLVKLISDSTVHENAVKLVELDKDFFQRSLEERIKKYLSAVDSIKSLKMYTRIMKRLNKGIPQLNSPSSTSQSPSQQPQALANNSSTSSQSVTPSSQQQPDLQHPQLSLPLAHLSYPQDPPTNN